MTNAVIAIILLLCILTSFILNKIPLGLTAVLGALAMAFFGVMPYSDVFSKFGSDTVMMVTGVMVIGNTLFETGCAQVLGRSLVRIKGVGTNEKIFLTVMLILSALLSAFVSNTATVAMMLPLIASVAAASNQRISKKNTYMAVGLASVVGGNATLAGSTPQLVAQGVLEQTAGCRKLTFFELTRGTIPIAVAMVLYFVTVGYGLQKKVFDFQEVPNGAAETRTGETFSMRKILTSAVIFVASVVCFATGAAPFGIIAMTGACLCCLTGCITPKRIWETMDWRTLVVLGGSLGFATGMEKSGALKLIAQGTLTLIGGERASIWLVSAVLIGICAILGNMMSHTATAAIMTPFAIALAHGMNQDAIPYVIMVIIGCNLAFATPMSTPPLTMTLVGGYRFTDYLKVGGAFTLISVAVAIVTIPLLYGLA